MANEAPKAPKAPKAPEIIKDEMTQLRDLHSGDEIVVKREPFIKLMHDLVHGNTAAWVGSAGKKKLAAMCGVEGKEGVDQLYKKYKQTFTESQKRDKSGVHVSQRAPLQVGV